MKAMIMAAGMGTRLKPLTDDKPKALVTVGGHTMLDNCLAYLKKYGITDIVINVHHFAEQLYDYAKLKEKEGFKIQISDESEQLMDTGGALVKAAPLLGKEPFIMMAVDILTNLNLQDFIDYHRTSGNLVSLAVKDRKTSRSLMLDKNNNLCGWRHNETGEIKKVNNNEVVSYRGFSVIHMIDPKIFELITEQGPFPIIDMYLRLAKTEKFGGFDHSQDTWMEFGRVENIREAEQKPEFLAICKNLYS